MALGVTNTPTAKPFKIKKLLLVHTCWAGRPKVLHAQVVFEATVHNTSMLQILDEGGSYLECLMPCQTFLSIIL